MIDHVLFDLDGTLTDPADGITASAAYAFTALGHTPPPRAELEGFIGPPLDEMFGGAYGYPPDKITLAVRCFREYFSTRGIFENKLYPGIPQMLEALCAQGKTLYVATSKPTVFAKKILEHFDISQYFSDVEGSPLEHNGVAKNIIVETVLQRNKISPSTAVMVGDRRHDIAGGQANSLITVGFLPGYSSPNELEQAGATHIASDVPSLQKILLSL